MIATDRADPARILEAAALGLVRGEFDRPDKPDRARFAHQGMIGKAPKNLREIGAEFGCVLYELLRLQDFDVLERHRGGHRMPGIGHAVIELAAFVEELL